MYTNKLNDNSIPDLSTYIASNVDIHVKKTLSKS